MRICVLSDTHIPDRYDALPEQLVAEIKRSDLVIHAGDFTSFELYQQLKRLKPVKAVRGNMDAAELREELKDKEIFSVQKFKIGIMHGYGKPEKIVETISGNFDPSFDLVIFGHSHEPCQEKIGKTIYFNPGSPTDKIFAPYNAFGLVEIDGDLRARIEKITK
ncbi:MAG: metallophosphoesterase family protein [Candidatus Omnitrophica bacterium]|nr:metallophosphoesterase family protein [Candidatus Omnitrophota bacterium]